MSIADEFQNESNRVNTINKIEKLQRREEKYKRTLNEIVNPIKYLQIEANKNNKEFNGYFANEISNNARYLKRIAELALIELDEEEYYQF